MKNALWALDVTHAATLVHFSAILMSCDRGGCGDAGSE